jgi:hypothetical protein
MIQRQRHGRWVVKKGGSAFLTQMMSKANAMPNKDFVWWVPIQKQSNLVDIKTRGKLNLRHMADIPGIKFLAQRRWRARWPFLERHQ